MMAPLRVIKRNHILFLCEGILLGTNGIEYGSQ